MTDIELITRNIQKSIESAKVPEVCLIGYESLDTEVDTANVAIYKVDNTVRALVAALGICAINLPSVDVTPESLTETQINKILKVTEEMAKINEALRVLGESKIYLDGLKTVLSCKY